MLAIPWHEGELKIHRKLLGNRPQDNPTQPLLRGDIALPLLALGALDSTGQPWSTLWGRGYDPEKASNQTEGVKDFVRLLGQNLVGVKAAVDTENDPVVRALLLEDGKEGESTQHNPRQSQGKMISGLTIDLDRRKRVKLFGRFMAGVVSAGDGDDNMEAQLIMNIEQSLGNCPKYLNRKRIIPGELSPKLVSDSPTLSLEALSLIAKADLFFISSTNANIDMDTNHRGGPPGFARTSTSNESTQIIWPEFSGNLLYQTLGNLEITPLAGLVFPDFDTGDVLYVTGRTETLAGEESNQVIPHSNLSVRLTVSEAKLVHNGLTVRGMPIEASPYNPRVRPLASEARSAACRSQGKDTAMLMEQTSITPTISKFKFALSRKAEYQGGQWVAFDFSGELNMGYSHMRDDDPRSLNDDFVRTFTVSSPPPAERQEGDLRENEFEITARKVGVVTSFMFQQQARHGLEVPMKGFGGDFMVQLDGQAFTPFVAGGAGITPLLSRIRSLDVKRLRLFWSIHTQDANLVVDTLRFYPQLAESLTVFLTGDVSDRVRENEVSGIQCLGASVKLGRFQKRDLLDTPGLSSRWYVCVGTKLLSTLMDWLQDKEVHFEEFNF